MADVFLTPHIIEGEVTELNSIAAISALNNPQLLVMTAKDYSSYNSDQAFNGRVKKIPLSRLKTYYDSVKQKLSN